MSRDQNWVRVNTGPTIGGSAFHFALELFLIMIKCAIELVRVAVKLGCILWVKVLVPGMRLAAQQSVRLASTLARWNSERARRQS